MSDEIKSLVSQVALLIDTPEKGSAVRRRAEDVAKVLDDDTLRNLAGCFGHPPELPADFRPDQAGAARTKLAWAQFWGEAVYEVLYRSGERALPGLREVVFGADGPKNDLAFPTLVRFAVDGIGRANLFEDVRREFPRMSSDSRVLLIDALMNQGRTSMAKALGRSTDRDAAFAEEVERLKDVPGFRAAERQWNRLQG